MEDLSGRAAEHADHHPRHGHRHYAERDAAARLDPSDPAWGLIEIAHQSRAALSIIPAQDVLDLLADEGTLAVIDMSGPAAALLSGAHLSQLGLALVVAVKVAP